MVDLLLVFFAPFAFGFLVALGAGLSKSEGTGRAFVSGLLGGGVVLELLVLWQMANDIDVVMRGLLGFSLGGILGLAIGLAARRWIGIPLRARAAPPRT